MFLIFLFLALFSLTLSHRLYHTILSPIGIFGVLWNGLLALFEIRLLNYNLLSAQAYVAFIGSFVLFVFGVLIATLPVSPVRRWPTPIQVLNPERTRRVLDLLNTLGLLGLLLTTVQLAQLVGWGALLETVAVRQAVAGLEVGQFGGGLAGYSLALAPLAGIIGGIYLAQDPSGHLRAMVCLLVSLGNSVLTGNRSLFIWTLVLFAVAYMLTRVFANHEPVRNLGRWLILASVALFVVFGAIGVLRFSQFLPFEESNVNVKLPWTVLQAYHYVTSGFGAFSMQIADPVHIDLPGVHTFAPVIRAIARVNLGIAGYSYEFIVQYANMRHTVYIPVGTNVFTYLGGLFDDWGWWGIVLVPLGIGTLSGFTFLKLIKRPSFGVIALYSLLCLQYVYASALPITYSTPILVTILGLLMLRNYVSKKREHAQHLLPVVDAIGVSK